MSDRKKGRMADRAAFHDQCHVPSGLCLYVLQYPACLLVYRLLSEKEKKARIYYGVILLVSLIGCSALFLWFEFFSHTDGVRYVDEIIANAKAMTKPFNGMTYHDTLIDHEILGIDLSDVEYPYA